MRTYMWGLYSHSRKYRKIRLRHYFFEICIRTFANMYLPLRPLPLYGYSGCIHTPLMPILKIFFWELISEQIHAAHVFAPSREYRKLFLSNYLCIGFVPGDSVPLLKGPSKKKAQRKVAGPFAISPQQFLITPQQFPITPQQFLIAPRLHLHFLIFSDLIAKNYTYPH